MMRFYFHILGLFVAFLIAFPFSCFAIRVKDDRAEVVIKTDMYELVWKKSETMGYRRGVAVGVKNLINAVDDSPFFHWGDWGNGEAWGETDKVLVIEEKPGKVVVEYTSKGTQTFKYSCVATYWDGVSFFKHEVRGTNIANEAKVWPVSGHDPVVNPGFAFRADKRVQMWNDPLPHVAYWTKEGFLGLYSANPKAKPKLGDWRGEGEWIQLDHDWQIALIDKKQQSEPVIYFIALAKGGEAEAHGVATQIANFLAKPEKDPRAVKPTDKMSVTWGELKAWD